MNYFLLAVIVALCGGGYYEYTLVQQNNASYQQQISDLEAKITKLQLDNGKIDNDRTDLSSKLTAAQGKITALTAQIAAAEEAAKAEKAAKEAEEAAKAQKAAEAAAAAAKTAAVASSNSLGTVATLNGKTFENCQLLRVEADGITFTHSTGIMKVLFPLLQPDMQKRFGYDPHNGTSLTDEQVQALEAQRKAALKPAAAH